jgi:dynein heavy chain
LQDLDTYNKAAVAIAKKYFAINDIDDYYKKKDARPLIFCHFARGLSDKTYDEVRQHASVTTVCCGGLCKRGVSAMADANAAPTC